MTIKPIAFRDSYWSKFWLPQARLSKKKKTSEKIAAEDLLSKPIKPAWRSGYTQWISCPVMMRGWGVLWGTDAYARGSFSRQWQGEPAGWSSQVLKFSCGSGDDIFFPLPLLFSVTWCSEGSPVGGVWLRTAWKTPAFWKMLMKGWIRILSPSRDHLKHACVLAPDAWRGAVFAQHRLLFTLSGGDLAAGAKDYCHLFLLTCGSSQVILRVLCLLFGEETAGLGIWWRCLEIRS